MSLKHLFLFLFFAPILAGYSFISCSSTPKPLTNIDTKSFEDPSLKGQANTPIYMDEGIELPAWETIGESLGIEEDKIVATTENLANAIVRGKRSSAYANFCAESQEHCALLDAYFETADKSYQIRKKARRLRRKQRRRFYLKTKAIAWAQRLDVYRHIYGLRIRSKADFVRLAKASLKTKTCPRNLSAALTVRAENYLDKENVRGLARQLFDHAQPCLDKNSRIWEGIHVSQGLYAYLEGDKIRAEELLTEAMEAKRQRQLYRALFWLGKIKHEQGEEKEENGAWQLLIEKYPLSYYSIIVRKHWKKDPLENVPEIAAFDLKRISENRPEFSKKLFWLEALFRTEKKGAIKRWAEWMSKDLEGVELNVIHYLSSVCLHQKYYRQNIAFLVQYYRKYPEKISRTGLRALYPRPYFDRVHEASKGKIDSLFVLSLIRQESAFDARAVSPANARGLMQIIPRTARRLKRGGHRKLFDTNANTEMGVKYLMQLAKRFDGQMDLVLAGYNAGPRRVKQWLSRRPEREDPMLWSDLIPYMETRDYVTSILRNNYWYERLYGPVDPNMSQSVYSSSQVNDLLTASND